IEDGAVHEFFGAEPVIDDRTRTEVPHAGLHRAALVAGRAVIDAENSEKLALVLDDHAGAKLCRFDAAHMLPRKFADFGNSGRRTKVRSYAARGMTRGTLARNPRPAREISIRCLIPGGQSPPSLLAGSVLEIEMFPSLRNLGVLP